MWSHSFVRASVMLVLLFGIVPAAFAAPNRATTGVRTFRSRGPEDGFIKELSEDAQEGGIKATSAVNDYVGDDADDKQWRTFLSFDTSGLPNNAIVTKAVLKIRWLDYTGPDPWAALGNIKVYVKSGFFGSAAALEVVDWQAPFDLNAGTIVPDPNSTSHEHKATLVNAAEAYINLRGLTQIRLQFQSQDNDNNSGDGMYYLSGDHAVKSWRPTLRVEYTVP